MDKKDDKDDLTRETVASDLDTKTEDVLAALTAAWAGVGLAAAGEPLLAPLVAKVVGWLIPGQRRERLINFVKLLDQQVAALGSKIEDVEERFQSEEFVDLFEEAATQAARALSDDRREYLANLLALTLTEEEMIHARSKKLLLLLDELTDQEVIFLHSYFLLAEDRAKWEAFQEKHADVLAPASASRPAPVDEVDEHALQESYKATLVSKGLLKQQGRSLGTSWLGNMLLRYIVGESAG